jgi:hypothetical protein
VAESPEGSIVVHDTFGRQVALIKHANPKQQLALRDSTRRFETCLKPQKQSSSASSNQQKSQALCQSPHLWPGRYTAKMAVFYGLSGNATQQIDAKATFWYLPWWFLLAVLIVIILIVLLVMSIVRKVSGRKPKSKTRRKK